MDRLLLTTLAYICAEALVFFSGLFLGSPANEMIGALIWTAIGMMAISLVVGLRLMNGVGSSSATSFPVVMCTLTVLFLHQSKAEAESTLAIPAFVIMLIVLAVLIFFASWFLSSWQDDGMSILCAAVPFIMMAVSIGSMVYLAAWGWIPAFVGIALLCLMKWGLHWFPHEKMRSVRQGGSNSYSNGALVREEDPNDYHRFQPPY